MKTRYKLITTTLVVGTLLNTGCSIKDTKSTDKKAQEVIKKKDSDISAKEVIKRNTSLEKEISSTKTEITSLEKKIKETNPGKKRVKIVKKKAELEKRIENLQNKQVDNAKAFQLSQQKKNISI
ncbi:hypothetical protein FJR48_08510 [Sulfurimonas lithotrophica]|uniref:Uncharacterized protein n=1 Tax=Sulfurimonas lithotrophica TaxID=2590022 RepID=A0A5P8P212_9BACT|nr:hypothetical protein [Sulfurimonas lithotrophica]QFR49768.1 hypothetical protein FJR48_08510 [Sulfurimonas lithotrophica]